MTDTRSPEDQALSEFMHDLFEMPRKGDVLAALKAHDIETAARAWEEGRTAQAVSISSPINPYRAKALA